MRFMQQITQIWTSLKAAIAVNKSENLFFKSEPDRNKSKLTRFGQKKIIRLRWKRDNLLDNWEKIINELLTCWLLCLQWPV